MLVKKDLDIWYVDFSKTHKLNTLEIEDSWNMDWTSFIWLKPKVEL